MPRFFLLFFLILNCSVNADPKVLPLTTFKALITANVNGIEAGSRLYVASNDDYQFLKNIQITTGGTTITLDKINDLNDDGTPKSLTIAGDLIIKTSNNDSITGILTGYLYVTSKLQADDPTFSVYVIKNMHSVSVTGMKSTVVVLNTQLKSDSTDIDKPLKTSYVTSINQSPNTNIYFQWGIPSANWYDVTNNTFFMNPVNFKNESVTTRIFFDNVEPLQIGLDYWYFTVMGPVNMIIENKYVSNHDYTTTAVQTTGLIVNDFIFYKHTVNFQSDKTRSAVSGIYTSAFITGDINFTLEGDDTIFSVQLNHKNDDENLRWGTMHLTKLTVNSTGYLPGTFTCQYFTFTGDLLPTTISPPTTLLSSTVPTTSTVVSSTTVATSTKGSASLVRIELTVLLFVSVMLS